MSNKNRKGITILFNANDEDELNLLNKIKEDENHHAKTKLLWAKELNVDYEPKKKGRPKK